jgi:sulfur carrier protein
VRIEVNGEAREVAAHTLGAALDELGWAGAKVATALNGAFVPAAARDAQVLAPGDRLEVVGPMQGG